MTSDAKRVKRQLSDQDNNRDDAGSLAGKYYSSRDIRHLNSFTMRALQSPMQHKNQVGIIFIYRNRFIYLFQFLTLSYICDYCLFHHDDIKYYDIFHRDSNYLTINPVSCASRLIARDQDSSYL